MEDTPACVIYKWEGKEKLTAAQIDYVMRTLKRWNIVEVLEVSYYPKWDNLSLRVPFFARGTPFETLSISHHGKHATNCYQLDGFDCTMHWMDEDKEEEVVAKPHRHRALQSHRDAPYNLRSKR